jgi:PTH1 family peptidyl-tRNA hydrolase
MATIIIGLGNPGEKFKNTKHNVGFLVLDALAKNNNFENFALSKKNLAEISSALFKTSADKEDQVVLVKPQTFMNDSGKSVQKLSIHYKLQATNYIVVHDDIDLPIGKIKIVKERGSAGHKGVESIIKAIGNENLVRFRIGIAKEINSTTIKSPQQKTQALDVVLKKFSSSEKEIINSVITKTTEALNFYLINGLEKTMNEYN